MLGLSKRRRVSISWDGAWDRARGRLSDWVMGALRRTVREQLDWAAGVALGYAVRYLVGGALFVVASTFLLLALREGLVALGLPPGSASLLLGATAALIGLLLIRARGRAPARKAHRPRGVAIKVARGVRTRRGRGPILDVHAAGEGWEVTRGRRGPRAGRYGTKAEAVRAARRAAAGRELDRVVVHRADGTVENGGRD